MRVIPKLALIAALLATTLPSAAMAQYVYTYSDALNPSPAILTAPEIGTRRVVSAGESILSQENGRWADGIIIDEAYSPQADTPNSFSTVPGDKFFRIRSKSVVKACSLKMGPREGALGSHWPFCFLDDDGDGRFDRVANDASAKARPLLTQVAYHPQRILLPPLTAGFTRRLLYQGAASGSLVLRYREFKDDLARPAFEEELTIPLDKVFPQKIAAKGAVFRIYNIDGLGLEYELEALGSFAESAVGWIAPSPN
jgi:hypothetical protein